MKDWFLALQDCETQGLDYVLITVVAVQGSAPRTEGTKMLVTADQRFDTIGGGHLEYKAIKQSRDMLQKQQSPQPLLQHYPLAASLGQCCGGRVTLLFEPFIIRQLPIIVFGAGHVGRALVPLLAQLPISVIWVDSRYDMFPANCPQSVQMCHHEHPVDQVDNASPGSCFLVMTHHHGMDLALTEAILKRGDALYLGVIGSVTKGRRFRQRLSQRGFTDDQLHDLHCPMGKVGIKGKRPIEIAIAIAAQIMELYQQPLQLTSDLTNQPNSVTVGSSAPTE